MGTRESKFGSIDAIVLAPAVLGLVLYLAADYAPQDQVWGHIANAVGRSAYRWLCLLSPLWALVARWRSGRWSPTMVVAIAVLPLAGRPAVLQESGHGAGPLVLVANVNAYVSGVDLLEDAVNALDPEVFIQVESRTREIRNMVTMAHNFDTQLVKPSHATSVHCIEIAPSSDALSCEAAVTPEFGSSTMKMPVGLARTVDGVCIMGLHGPPPVPYDASGLDPYMRRIADRVRNGAMVEDWLPCHLGDPVVIAGDVNAVPDSWAIGLLAPTGLTDRLAGWGVFATTWPAGGGWTNLPLMQLDHLFASPALAVSDITFVRLPRSDHKGLMFRVRPRAPAAP